MDDHYFVQEACMVSDDIDLYLLEPIYYLFFFWKVLLTQKFNYVRTNMSVLHFVGLHDHGVAVIASAITSAFKAGRR